MFRKLYDFIKITKNKKKVSFRPCVDTFYDVSDYRFFKYCIVPYDDLPEYVRCNIKREDYLDGDE